MSIYHSDNSNDICSIQHEYLLYDTDINGFIAMILMLYDTNIIGMLMLYATDTLYHCCMIQISLGLLLRYSCCMGHAQRFSDLNFVDGQHEYRINNFYIFIKQYNALN